MTELELSVPEQPVRTDADVQRFLSGGFVSEDDGSGGRAEGVIGQKGADKGGKPMGKGSIMAWLGHLDVLKWYVSLLFSSCRFLNSLTTSFPLVRMSLMKSCANYFFHLRLCQNTLLCFLFSCCPFQTSSHPERLWNWTVEVSDEKSSARDNLICRVMCSLKQATYLKHCWSLQGSFMYLASRGRFAGKEKRQSLQY